MLFPEKKNIYEGKVIYFNEIKGFGYVDSLDFPDEKLLIHFTNINQSGFRKLKLNDNITFEIQKIENVAKVVNIKKKEI